LLEERGEGVGIGMMMVLEVVVSVRRLMMGLE
jgi:hypothetical protein